MYDEIHARLAPLSGRVDALVRSIDLLPTLVDVMELECPPESCSFDGTSLRDVIEGEPVEARTAYSEAINDLAAYYNTPLENDSLYAIHDGRFKFIARYEGRRKKPSMLFDLSADPRESKNIIEEHPDAEERMRGFLEELGAIAGDKAGTPLSEETLERLRSLGYVK